jgi:hypothetical protein
MKTMSKETKIIILSIGLMTIGAVGSYAVNRYSRYYNYEEARKSNAEKITNAPVDKNEIEIRVFTPESRQRFESTCKFSTAWECQPIWNEDCKRMFGEGVWQFYIQDDARPGCKNVNYNGGTLYFNDMIW